MFGRIFQMRPRLRKPKKPVFKPQDRYFVNRKGWWFYTVDMISGPYNSKPECVDACRLYIQTRDGVLDEPSGQTGGDQAE